MLLYDLLSFKGIFKTLFDFGNASTRLMRILYWTIIVAVVVGVWIFIGYKRFMKDLDRHLDKMETKSTIASLNKDDDEND